MSRTCETCAHCDLGRDLLKCRRSHYRLTSLRKYLRSFVESTLRKAETCPEYEEPNK